MASKTHIKDLILGDDQMDFPNNDGADGQVLTTDGAQSVTWEYPYANMDLENLQDVSTGIGGKSLLYKNHLTNVWEGYTTAALASYVQAETDLQDLNNVDGSPTSGEFLKWNGSSWVTEAITDTDTDALADLTDTTFTGLAAGDWLYYSGSAWVNLNGANAATIFGINMNLTTLANVNAATPSDGDVLTWDSGTSKWVNEAPAATVTELDDLSDVVIGVDGGVTGSTALAPGDFFWYNGTTWRNYPAASAGSFLSNYIDLDDLDNVNTAIAGKSTGDFLKWNGSYWQADSISGVAETRLFENQGYNTVSSSEGFRYFLPGATTQGNRSTAGSETTLNPTSNGTNTWNQWKKLSHRVPSGTWTIDLNIDISMTSNSTGSGNASDYQEEDIEVRLFEVAPGVNGDCTLTQLGTTQYVTMDTTDTAEGKNLDYQVTGMSSGGRDRIVVVLKGTVSSASTRYCHWAYDLQITKTA